ncbi:unnamed protein product [Heligmosomoides polygyrus]|uniref:Protein kinase domain-containing protein n=1 Tax=Heligmosomoides polygyrus TaxID=6339 RepID=A0A3P8AG67_HELPZ|nr:unnamed protein product [Heligmosomoides polygyrus]
MEIRDSLCDLGRMEIPRPQFHGMQFVATRGKLGFYKTIRENGSKYGVQIKAQGPRRPILSNDIFLRYKLLSTTKYFLFSLGSIFFTKYLGSCREDGQHWEMGARHPIVTKQSTPRTHARQSGYQSYTSSLNSMPIRYELIVRRVPTS